jgi:chorismate--pyruvate lyase
MHPAHPHPLRPLQWQSSQQLRRALLPDAWRSWLLEPGSLTQRLRQCCDGLFHVSLLDQQLQRPLRDEARLLGRPPHELALVRQVRLCCDGKPWVFARTVIPLPSLKSGLKRIDQLGNRPLGELLFSDPDMQRSTVQLSRLWPGHPLHRLSGATPNAPLWGRRSVFTLYRCPLLVSEFFLPQLLERGMQR